MPLSPINATGTAASPIDGTGTILEYSTDGGSTWKQIANILDLKPHKMTAPKRDTTTHSTTGGVRTNAPKMGESGETELTLLYDKTAYGILAALWRVAGTVISTVWTPTLWRVTMNDAATDKCAGWLAEYGPGTPLDGDATIEIKINHSGAPTLVTT